MPARRLAQLLLAACTIAAPALGGAQSRFALELDIGTQVPLSPSVHNVVSLDVDADAGDIAIGTPRLSNRLNSIGLHIGVTALISTLEIRYRLEGFGWRGADTACIGDRQAQQLPNGEIEDAEVRYDCNIPETRISFDGEDRSSLTFHHLSVGPRFYAARGPRAVVRDGETVERERAQLYAVPFGGLTVARHQDPSLGPLLRAGFNVGFGVGAEFPLERRLSLVADLRYTFSVVGGSATPSARAGRAIATGTNVLGALMDTYHRVGLNLGLRFDFR